MCIFFICIFSQFLALEEGMVAPQSFVRALDGTGEEKDWMFAEALHKGRGLYDGEQAAHRGWRASFSFGMSTRWGYPDPDTLQRGVVKGCLWYVMLIVNRYADSKWKYNVYYYTLSINTYFWSISVHYASRIFRTLTSQQGHVWSKKLPNASKNISIRSSEVLLWSWCQGGPLHTHLFQSQRQKT